MVPASLASETGDGVAFLGHHRGSEPGATALEPSRVTDCRPGKSPLHDIVKFLTMESPGPMGRFLGGFHVRGLTPSYGPRASVTAMGAIAWSLLYLKLT